MKKQWFDVDRAGLGRQAEEAGKGRLVGELIQNALDEPGVTQIAVNLAMVPGQALAELTVEDDAPEGFHDLTHAYTLFAPSNKRGDAEKRGQFNLGEKLVLAVCVRASITTTKGAVIFDPDQGRTEQPDQKTDRGSIFQGRIKMTAEEYAQVCDYLRSLLLPDGIAVTFNGDRLMPRKPIHTFQASLETQIADSKGVMRPTTRKTMVSLYEPLPGEVPALYEMGLPIVETTDKWHVNVHQKVPLNKDRNNVPPRYLKAVRTVIVNEMHGKLTEEDANADWVRQASSDPNCSEEAIKRILDLRFGEKRAAFDPNDPEANKAWVAQGGTLVYGPMMSGNEWKKAKEAGAIQPSGKHCPSPKPYSKEADGKNVTIIAPDKWTPGMKAVADYAVMLGHELMQVPVTVTFVSRSLKEKQGHRSDQGKVWDDVKKQQNALGVKSGTSAMSDTYDKYEENLAQAQKAMQYVPGACGLAVAIGSQVVTADIFDKPATCQKLWDKLLSGLVLDALMAREAQASPDSSQVEELVNEARNAAWVQTEAVGDGQEYRTEFNGEVGSALMLDGSLVHGSVVAAG